MKRKMRALFLAGYAPEAAAAMRGWLAGGNEIAAIWCPLLQRRGSLNRDKRLQLYAPRWSVRSMARTASVSISEAPRLSTWRRGLDAVVETRADVLISVYFPYRVPQEMLDAVGGRAVNLHPAPLPRYRGPMPFQAMILDHSIEHEGAMTLHVMSAGLDEGDVIATEAIEFPMDRSLVRYSICAARAAENLTRNALPEFLEGRRTPVKQDATLARYFKPTDLEMALYDGMAAEEIRWRCDTLGYQMALSVEGRDLPRIIAFDRVLGPPTGAAPAVQTRFIDFDCMDSRIRLKRKMPWSTPLRRINAALTTMSETA